MGPAVLTLRVLGTLRDSSGWPGGHFHIGTFHGEDADQDFRVLGPTAGDKAHCGRNLPQGGAGEEPNPQGRPVTWPQAGLAAPRPHAGAIVLKTAVLQPGQRADSQGTFLHGCRAISWQMPGWGSWTWTCPNPSLCLCLLGLPWELGGRAGSCGSSVFSAILLRRAPRSQDAMLVLHWPLGIIQPENHLLAPSLASPVSDRLHTLGAT